MCRFIKLGVMLFISTTLGVGAGCYATAPGKHTHQPQLKSADLSAVSQQLIIKFKSGTVACDKLGIDHFSADAGLWLEFIRPMSGNACVVMHTAVNADTFIREQKILKRHPSVEWAEPDAVMKTQ